MNNEIEEIREYISCPQFGDDHYGKWGALRLEQRIKIKQLLDYITNLQEENNRLNNIIKELTQENLKRSDKIDELLEIKNKAIDYIEEKGRLKYKPDELINILQGSDKE